MITEQTIRQAVLNTINQVGCTGVKHVCWGLCEHTSKPAIPNEPTKVSAAREVEIFVNRVMYHVNAIQQAEIEKKIWENMIAVDLDKVDEAYQDGLKTGQNWKHTYIPGGPFYYGAGDHESDRSKAMAMQTQAEHAAWMQGFYEGNGIPVGSTTPMKLHNHGSCLKHQIQFDLADHTGCSFCVNG